MCLVLGSATYVSTMCPPFPTVAAEGTADAGDCVGALEAAQLDISCEGVSVDDSGATASEERVDAAGEAEAANREDAASDRDATADASDGAVRKPDAQ